MAFQNDLLGLMDKLPIFETCSKSEKRDVASYFEEVTYSEEENIFVDEDVAKSFYIILKGEISIVDKELGTQTTLVKEDFFGERAMFNSSLLRCATATAKTESVLAMLKKEAFDRIVQEVPHASTKILFQLTRIMGIRQMQANALLFAQ